MITLSSLDGALQLLVLLIAHPALALPALVILLIVVLLIAVAHVALSALLVLMLVLSDRPSPSARPDPSS